MLNQLGIPTGEERLPSVVPAECMVYFKPDFSMRRWTSAIWADTEGLDVPICHVLLANCNVRYGCGWVCLPVSSRNPPCIWPGLGVQRQTWWLFEDWLKFQSLLVSYFLLAIVSYGLSCGVIDQGGVKVWRGEVLCGGALDSFIAISGHCQLFTMTQNVRFSSL